MKKVLSEVFECENLSPIVPCTSCDKTTVCRAMSKVMQIIPRTRTLCQEPVCDNDSLGEIIAEVSLTNGECTRKESLHYYFG